jgi:hypothetical protein
MGKIPSISVQSAQKPSPYRVQIIRLPEDKPGIFAYTKGEMLLNLEVARGRLLQLMSAIVSCIGKDNAAGPQNPCDT